MKVLVQRVLSSQVEVNSECVGKIDKGLLLFVGFEKEDDVSMLDKMVHKLLNYRIFADDDGRMNLNVRDVQGGILAVSQFTLAAQTDKGLRPGFSNAAKPEVAEMLYDAFVARLRAIHSPVATGVFAADMQVNLVNDGPVTFLLEI